MGIVQAGARVRLCPVRRNDAADLIAANCASVELHRPWVDPFRDQHGFDRWFAQSQEGANVSLVARRQDSGQPVGVFNFSQIFMGAFQNAYLGYYACVPNAGCGLMAEALLLAATYAFRVIGLHRIEANIQPHNLRSIALVRGAGFRREGYSPRYLHIAGAWRDHERWTLLADD